MHKHKRINEGVLYEAPNTRSKIHNEVKEELAGNWSFLTDTQGLRLAYESLQKRKPVIHCRNKGPD